MEGQLKIAGILLPSADVLWTVNTGCASIHSSTKAGISHIPRLCVSLPQRIHPFKIITFPISSSPVHRHTQDLQVKCPVTWVCCGEVSGECGRETDCSEQQLEARHDSPCFPLTLRCWARYPNSRPPTSPFTNLLQRQ